MALDSPRQREIEQAIGELLEEWTAIEHVDAGEAEEPIFISGWVAVLEYSSPSMAEEHECGGCNVYPDHQSVAMTVGLMHQGISHVD